MEQGGELVNRKIDKTGITMVEILVVIAIIALITAAAIPVYNKARVRALIVRTKTTINAIEAALSMYTTDFGDYPAFDGTETKLLVGLLQGPVDSNLWKGPYMRFKEKDLDENGNILDAWSTPLYYKYPQDDKTNVPYLIISAGIDRKLQTEDDIGNW
ncbi:type II secretion system protein GspG [bacterium]|nr:type II secretion system protein GspG [bacterium]